MAIRFAFAGFRHGHIFDLLSAIGSNAETSVVAQCEEDSETREALKSREGVKISHDNFDRMLKEVQCDVVAIGDYYTKRGNLAIKALEAGKHVISDKPLCCTLDELGRISELSSRSNLAVGCQFDLRGAGALVTARKLIQDDEIGEIQTISFSGQHPLSLGSRPAWYFVPGCHGGTINDIAVHAIDAIPWVTGRKIATVVAARVWNARTPQHPHFQDGAQMMLQLDNRGGVLGDVSYLAPEGCGVPQYWRFTFHGSRGIIETYYKAKEVMVANTSDKSPRGVKCEENIPRAYLPDFLKQVRGESSGISLSTADVLQASKVTLIAQNAGDQNKTNVSCI